MSSSFFDFDVVSRTPNVSVVPDGTRGRGFRYVVGNWCSFRSTDVTGADQEPRREVPEGRPTTMFKSDGVTLKLIASAIR
ncbi:MAG: hypothetical protein GXX84_19905 [Acidobacteria bacterium]|nr:hypothetical protein [Acidobacteriota bacterium]